MVAFVRRMVGRVTKSSIFRILTVLTAILIFAPQFASAAGNNVANGFSVSPVIEEQTINKGSSEVVPIYVQNPTSVPSIAHPVVYNFTASSNESGSPRLILQPNAPQPVNDFRSLVSGLTDLHLGPNQQLEENLTLSVPKNANSGGYYGTVCFVPSNGSSTSDVGLTASVCTLFLVTVPGNLVQKLTLVQLSAGQNNQPGGFFMHGDIQVITRLRNDGNIYSAPFGNIEIKDMFGGTVAQEQLNSTKGNILPNSIRKFVNNLPKYHYLGRYTIVASIGYGQKGSLIVGQSSFWYFPAWFVITAIVVILLILALIYFVVHRIRSRHLF